MGKPNLPEALPGYISRGGLRRWRLPLIGSFLIILLLHGFFWAIGGKFLLVPLMAVPAIMLLFVIWLMPDTNNPPVTAAWRLFVAFIFALLWWPDYIALTLPALPWITMVRLIGVPLALVMLYSLSVSRELRAQLIDTFSATPLVWRLLAIFALTAVISLVFSDRAVFSANKLVIAALTWFMVFIAASALFREASRLEVLLNVTLATVFFVCFIALWEMRIGQLPWVGHIPSFLTVDDPQLERIISPKTRAAEGLYRVQSKFTTPLGLAEFLALAAPLLTHMMLTHQRLWMRGLAALGIPLSLYVIYLTDSRLGLVGIGTAGLMFLLVIGIEHWRARKGSILGPLIMLSYPLVGLLVVASTFVIGSVRRAVWGGGAEQYSTDAREEQYTQGFRHFIEQPWGYGIGNGGEVLNFRNPAGEVTIDTYVVVVALEYGAIGFLAYFGMFIAAIYYGIRCWFGPQVKYSTLLAPLIITMVVFMVVKLVFAQQENHPFAFILLGALVALIRYVELQREKLPQSG